MLHKTSFPRIRRARIGLHHRPFRGAPVAQTQPAIRDPGTAGSAQASENTAGRDPYGGCHHRVQATCVQLESGC